MWNTIKIKGLEFQYEANRKGQVRNSLTKQILQGNLKKNGYLEYCLYYNGEKKYYLGHVLIANVFLDNPNNYDQINHIDGNKQNNSVENLEWISSCGNNKHAWENELNHPHVLRPVRQYDLNYNYIKTFESIISAVNATGATKIRDVCNGYRKTSGNYIWEWDEEFVPEDRGRKKKVAQFNKEGKLINTFESVSEAARQTGANRKGISAVCLGKQKTCFNYYWKFIEDEIVQ